MNNNYLVNKKSTVLNKTVKEATEILAQYGISHNEHKTRDYISKGKLKAVPQGKEGDRRKGYLMNEKALYELIVSEIPIMKEIFEELMKPTAKPTSKPTPRGQAQKKATTTTKKVESPEPKL